MSKLLILTYIFQFKNTKSIKEIANDLGFGYEHVRLINQEFETTGYITVHSSMNRNVKRTKYKKVVD